MSVVVGAALISDGKVLAARRTTPSDLAGLWEFPGGKVEPDETEPQALLRELREELSLDAHVGELLGGTTLGSDRELKIYACEPIGGPPRPNGDHDCVRWLSAEELHSVSWLEGDRRLLDRVRAALVQTRLTGTDQEWTQRR